MKIDAGLGFQMGDAATAAAEAEAAGYDGIWSVETSHDPFFPLVVAAGASQRLELGTGIAVAFSRSPMNMAAIANDLQAYSEGRFILGLGSQIKPHIEKRFSMTWSGKPAAQMREFVLAMRAIWACWNEDQPLAFEGEHYRHTLMTPFFNPGPNPYGTPRVTLAGVGPLMTQVAGEVCDGFLCHAFTTRAYFDEVTMPALERGWAKAGRSREDFEISGPGFIVTGTTEEEIAAAAEGTKGQIAFYGSTPAYKGVLEQHGWGDLQADLNRLSKEGRWQEMGALITDDILDEFAIIGAPEEIAAKWKARWGGAVDRLSFYAPYKSDPERWSQVLADFKAP